MKILFVTNMFPTQDDSLWRGKFVEEQLNSIIEQSPETSVDLLHIKGKISGGSFFNYIKAIFTFIKLQKKNHYDLVHIHHFLCLFVTIFSPAIRVYTVHEGEVSKKSIRSLLIKIAIYFSDATILVNHSLFKKMKKSKSLFLPCGINTSQFRYLDKLACLKAINAPENKFIILFPASPDRPEKNADLLRQAIAKISGVDIHILWGGSIPPETMHLYINASDVVVNIGNYESDGLTVKEAISCQTPIISTRVGNAEIYIKHRANGSLINVADVNSLAQEILYWSGPHQQANITKEENSTYHDIDIKKKTNSLLNFYRDVLNDKQQNG